MCVRREIRSKFSEKENIENHYEIALYCDSEGVYYVKFHVNDRNIVSVRSYTRIALGTLDAYGILLFASNKLENFRKIEENGILDEILCATVYTQFKETLVSIS